VPADAIDAWLHGCPTPMPDHIRYAILALLSAVKHIKE
jgi:hypothetical protein